MTSAQNAISTKNLARPSSKQKKLGVFYTPEDLSKILTNWAIKSAQSKILEPSFGGCGFLSAARKRLTELGCRNPNRQIFGCDIDPSAFKHLSQMLEGPVDLSQFKRGDFLSLQPNEAWPHLFEVSIGNPPYIPFQAIKTKQRQELEQRAKALEIPMGGRASLWAHFLVHALQFLKADGRLAWVLPGSFLQTDYAKGLRNYLAKSFNRVLAIQMRQRLFLSAGTDEETVILIAEGWKSKNPSNNIKYAHASSLDDLKQMIASWESGEIAQAQLVSTPAKLSLSQESRIAFANLANSMSCHTLGDYGRINIGVVTGANNFFVLSSERAKELGIDPKDLRPILAKFRAAPALNLKRSDHTSYLNEGGKGLLVHVEVRAHAKAAIQKYLSSFDTKERKKVGTFKKRKVWCAPDDGKIPSAFFPVMHHDGPRLVLNGAKMNCTNTVHKFFFDDSAKAMTRKLLAISLLTSFSQLSSEFVGRRYGSGVLKHEPREAERINVLMPDNVTLKAINRTFKKINQKLRAGKLSAARLIADNFILSKIDNASPHGLTLRNALNEVRTIRRPTKKV